MHPQFNCMQLLIISTAFNCSALRDATTKYYEATLRLASAEPDLFPE